eukprot:Rhum_TRINITY_DN14938_c19_g1::Rhum_TRINITY_DN14938_c19_g1_i1::g.130241::m.130241/K20198/KIF17; kinesin family member 17
MTKEKKQASENVQVVVRVRPISQREQEQGSRESITSNLADNSVTVHADGDSARTFSFDRIYTKQFTQKDIYTQSIHPLVDSVLGGYNATVFAYGQSGSGKTYTMTGGSGASRGVIPHALDHIFESTRQEEAATDRKTTHSIRISYVELYNGLCRDLLTDTKSTLELKENEHKLFYVKGLEQVKVSSPEQCLRLLDEGHRRREVGCTMLNEDSSRSHSVFTVEITSMSAESEPPVIVVSKLNLVDLAGSERQGKTATTGKRFEEGKKINLSLTALGSVIDSLVKKEGHIPFRSSHLTMLLKDSLGGNCRTVMFATCSPVEYNASETMSTLRFADRAKKIKNTPRVQLDPKDELLQQLREEVALLKKRLQAAGVDEDAENQKEDSYDRLQVEAQGLRSEVESLTTDLHALSARHATVTADAEDQATHLNLLKAANKEAEALVSAVSAALREFVAALPFPAAAKPALLCAEPDEPLPARSIPPLFASLLSLLTEGGGGGSGNGAAPPKVSTGAAAAAGAVHSNGANGANGTTMHRRSPDSAGLTASPQSNVSDSAGGGTANNVKSHGTNGNPPLAPERKKKKRGGGGGGGGGASDVSDPSREVGSSSGDSTAAEGEVQLLAAEVARLRHQAVERSEDAQRLKDEVAKWRGAVREVELECAASMEQSQAKMVQENNRRIEEVLVAHGAEVQRLKKLATEAKRRVRKAKEAHSELECKYDEHIVAYDALFKDFEDLKLQSLKQLQSSQPGRSEARFHPQNVNTIKLTSLAAVAGRLQGDIANLQASGHNSDRTCSKSAPLAPHGLPGQDSGDALSLRPMSTIVLPDSAKPLFRSPLDGGGGGGLTSPVSMDHASPRAVSPQPQLPPAADTSAPFAKAPLPRLQNLSPREEPMLAMPVPPASKRVNKEDKTRRGA